jgi:hypothetical protein
MQVEVTDETEMFAFSCEGIVLRTQWGAGRRNFSRSTKT